MDKRIIFEREDSICNICSLEKPLSWDHIPPKGAVMLSEMWVENHFKKIDGVDKKSISRNGLKYKTICRDCNSFLGEYDRAYIEFILDFKSYIKTFEYMILPYIYRVSTQPIKIAKSILGHLLASKTGLCNSKYDKLIKEYILSADSILPENIRIFYWFYDYPETTISVDNIFPIGIANNIGSKVFSVIKCFPIAFAITFDNKVIPNTTELKIFTSDTINTHREIYVDMRMQNSWDYPDGLKYNPLRLVSVDNTDIIATHKHRIVGKTKKRL